MMKRLIDKLERVTRQVYWESRERLGLMPPDPGAELQQAYEEFARISEFNNIRLIQFVDGEAVLTLNDGRRFVLDPRTPAGRLYTVPKTGTFEETETDFLRRNIPPGSVCVDAGACFGWHTVLMARAVGCSGAVHAFEPVPKTCELLQRNIELNELENVRIEQSALSDEKAERNIYVPDIGVSGALELHAYRKDYEVIKCRSTTLDHYAEQTLEDRLDFLKVDIEGAELSMLRGGEKTIATHRPTCLVEVQAHSTSRYGHAVEEVFDWFVTFGYEPHRIDASGELQLCTATEAEEGHNFVFLPR